jgi:hypothetical protein
MIGIEFLITSKLYFSFLEKEFAFEISEEYAKNDGKSDWLIYRNNHRAVQVIYDWHDEYTYVIIFRLKSKYSELPFLGEADDVLYLENLIINKGIQSGNLLQGDLNNYKTTLLNAAELLLEFGKEILNGEKWISNSNILNELKNGASSDGYKEQQNEKK